MCGSIVGARVTRGSVVGARGAWVQWASAPGQAGSCEGRASVELAREVARDPWDGLVRYVVWQG
jgi:hypothetical protein